ncbi:MAG: TIGR00730 family Rossman fold protein, partial [Verrucomicrobia bacterium]|nr:TIGR00730 family Rossman fold protein [Verrucomicrobiota bacterium]
MRTFRRLCVYCGSSNHVPETYFAAARAVGTLLAERGIGVVYGGGRTGLMGAVATAALAAGGEVIGVIPEKLRALELDHGGLTELRVVDSMHARKLMMAELSDGFMALPGGFGTLEEIFEATTWTQLNYHRKPAGLLNT